MNNMGNNSFNEVTTKNAASELKADLQIKCQEI